MNELQKTITHLVKHWLIALAEQSELEGIADRMRIASQRFADNYINITALVDLLEEFN